MTYWSHATTSMSIVSPLSFVFVTSNLFSIFSSHTAPKRRKKLCWLLRSWVLQFSKGARSFIFGPALWTRHGLATKSRTVYDASSLYSGSDLTQTLISSSDAWRKPRALYLSVNGKIIFSRKSPLIKGVSTKLYSEIRTTALYSLFNIGPSNFAT